MEGETEVLGGFVGLDRFRTVVQSGDAGAVEVGGGVRDEAGAGARVQDSVQGEWLERGEGLVLGAERVQDGFGGEHGGGEVG